MGKDYEPDRPKTNSITHLVKIVAKEVTETKFSILEDRISILVDRVKKLENGKPIDVAPFLENIKSSMEEAWQPWKKEEHELLIAELKVAITTIAKNHKRSKGAITTRIDKERLMEMV